MLTVVLLGALAAGFMTGFAGFGTGLVASGLWFHALPMPMVPPLVAQASVAAQSIGIITVRKAFDWNKAQPFLLGGLIGARPPGTRKKRRGSSQPASAAPRLSATSLQRQWKLRIPRSDTRNRLAVAPIAEQVPIGVRSKAQRSHGKIDIVESR